MDKLLPLKTDPFAKKLQQKTEVLCKFASKQEVLTNCCKIETLQPKKIAAKESYLKFCFKFVTLPQVCNTIFCLKPLEFYHLLCCPPPPIFSLN
jgi:hypothetical protein